MAGVVCLQCLWVACEQAQRAVGDGARACALCRFYHYYHYYYYHHHYRYYYYHYVIIIIIIIIPIIITITMSSPSL